MPSRYAEKIFLITAGGQRVRLASAFDGKCRRQTILDLSATARNSPNERERGGNHAGPGEGPAEGPLIALQV